MRGESGRKPEKTYPSDLMGTILPGSYYHAVDYICINFQNLISTKVVRLYYLKLQEDTTCETNGLVDQLLDGQFDVANLTLELAGFAGGHTCGDDGPRDVAGTTQSGF